MVGLWWMAFAQVISLVCKNQKTAVMLLLLFPLFEQIFSGNYCSMVIGSGLEAGFCPRGSMDGQNFYPGHDFFRMMWIAELHQFPTYVMDFPAVNSTNYWDNMPVDELTSSGTVVLAWQEANATALTYSVGTFAVDGGMAGWWLSFAKLFFLNLYLRLLCLVLLAFMAASTNRWVADKIALVSYHADRVFGCCKT